VLIYAHHLTFTIYHSLESSDFPESSCSGLGAWSLWILLITDQSGAVVAWFIG